VREDENHLPVPNNSANTDDVGKLLTIPEACDVLRVSKWTVRRLIQSRQLATVKIRRRRLVPIAAVKELLDRLRAEESA
jgi:excisionase family DNA binding protein